MIRLILGSQSPRRKEILKYFTLPFEHASPSFTETSIPFEGDPVKYAESLSEGKAASLIDRFSKCAIITFDTIVYYKGSIFGKPADLETAYETLTTLSGKWHSVFTAVTLRYGADIFTDTSETRVLFNGLTPEQINAYLRTQSWSDKAAGYAIQQSGGIIVNRIEGCFYNVMGFPINTVSNLLKKIGIDLWNHLKS